MARYIDADKAQKHLRVDCLTKYPTSYIDGLLVASNEIDNTPTADVVEVVHGHNKTSMHPVDEFWCSECGFCCADYTETKYDEDGDYTYSCECEFDYCPRCGAKMDGGKAE